MCHVEHGHNKTRAASAQHLNKRAFAAMEMFSHAAAALCLGAVAILSHASITQRNPMCASELVSLFPIRIGVPP